MFTLSDNVYKISHFLLNWVYWSQKWQSESSNMPIVIVLFYVRHINIPLIMQFLNNNDIQS
jgi:hypothetical protein